jgi:hypothetical protein
VHSPADLRKIDADAYDIVPASRGVRRHIRTTDRSHGTIASLLERFPDALVSNRVVLVAVVAYMRGVGFGGDLGYALGVFNEVAVYPREMLEASIAIAMAGETDALVSYFKSIRAMPGRIEPWITAKKH